MRLTARRAAAHAAAFGAVPLAVASMFALSNGWTWWWPSDHASAVLVAPDGTRLGSVRFQEREGGTQVIVRFNASDGRLAAGHHGMHVHANADTANGDGCVADPSRSSSEWFLSADGHLVGDGSAHGTHQGDLPSVLVDDGGRAAMQFTTQEFSVEDVDGAAVVVHARPDNFGNVPGGTTADTYSANGPEALEKTAKTGNAGDRLACGVIRRD